MERNKKKIRWATRTPVRWCRFMLKRIRTMNIEFAMMSNENERMVWHCKWNLPVGGWMRDWSIWKWESLKLINILWNFLLRCSSGATIKIKQKYISSIQKQNIVLVFQNFGCSPIDKHNNIPTDFVWKPSHFNPHFVVVWGTIRKVNRIITYTL